MKNKLILLVGISGAGKSTFSEKYLLQNPQTRYLSSDKLRKDLSGDENNQSVTPMVFGIIKAKTNEYLRNGDDVMIDATSLNPKERKDYISYAKTHGTKVIAYVFERTREQLIQNQEKRAANGGRRVPDDVIDRMLKKYIRPQKIEGFDEINLI